MSDDPPTEAEQQPEVEEDLTGESATKADSREFNLSDERPERDDLETPHRQKIEWVREWTRIGLAAAVILPFPFLIIIPWVALAFHWGSESEIQDLAQVLIPATTTGLAGIVLGFYFARLLAGSGR